jgi:hypothetical protein
MDINKLREPLRADQIEFRVQSINKGGYATILAYKDARVDQQRLDDVVGPLNWQRQHVMTNHNCIVSIWNENIGQWVYKEDTGTESNTEAQKGLASDSFKRACFNWGIGRELYDYPQIQLLLRKDEWQLQGDKAKATWNLKIREWIWHTAFEDGKLSFMTAIDEAGNKRFEWGRKPAGTPKVDIKAAIKKDVFDQSVSCMENGDSDGLKEVWAEFGADEKAVLWGLFNSQQRTAMKELLK